jgi:hypothetical protein
VSDTAAQRRQALEARLGRLQKLFEWGDVSKADYRAHRAQIHSELQELRPVTAKADQLGRLRELLASVATAWREASSEQKNRLARALYEEVWIESKRVVAVKPRPEFEPFFLLARQERYEKCGISGPDREPIRST